MAMDKARLRPPRLRPRSVPGLLIAGFAFVTLPLVAATIFAVVYVDRLSDQSERLIVQGVDVTRLSQSLNAHITAMERSARQYAILNDPSLARRFSEHHKAFNQTLGRIAALHLDAMPNWDLAALRRQAQQVGETVNAKPFSNTELQAQIERFERMRELAQVIGNQGNAFIDNELERIQTTSREVRFFLLLCTFALVPATLLMASLFTVVISRPIRQIQRAVARLGEGDFSQPIAISAPSAELDALGGQLDWMRRRLDALESEKNQFLQHMSHELKTPLASIREGAELLRDGTLGEVSQAQVEVVEILQRNTLELMALIENLLNFAAWKQQRAQLDTEDVLLCDLAQRVVERHRLTIDARHLEVHLPAPDIRARIDRDRMRLVLDNLVANAVKFSPDGGTIVISGRRGRHATIIEVSDEGPGIEEGEREHVFAPFYQAHPETGAHVRGTGIGLSVVRECVHAHGGDIRILRAAGGGSCFRIRIPDRQSPTRPRSGGRRAATAMGPD